MNEQQIPSMQHGPPNSQKSQDTKQVPPTTHHGIARKDKAQNMFDKIGATKWIQPEKDYSWKQVADSLLY